MAKTAANAAVRSDMLVYAALGIIAVATWWTWVYQIDLVYAMKGFSPIGWVYKTLHPADFALDFPGGTDNYSRSAFMHVYPLANSLGISPEALMPVVVAFEIVLFGWAMWALSRVLRPDAPRVVAGLVVVLALASPIRDSNLANFPQPYFVAQFYNVADVLRIFGIIMVLRGRLVSAAALLACAFATHPTLGLMGLACAAAMLLVRPRELLKAQSLAAAAVFVLIAGGWIALQYRSATISGGHIPLEDWITQTRTFSSHWYPVANTLLTTDGAYGGQYVLVPFLSFLLMLAYYWPGRDARSEVADRALAGTVAMLGLSVVGLVISEVVPVPILIKVALQRSNDLVVAIGLVYVVAGLWRDIRGDQWWRCAIATTMLVSLSRTKTLPYLPSVIVPVFPLLWSMALPIVLGSPGWLRVLRRQPASAANWAVAVLAATGIGLGLLYLSTAGTTLNVKALVGGGRAIVVFGGILWLSAVFARRNAKPFLQGAAAVAVIALALVGLKERADHKLDPDMARGYLQAQLWARDHTRRDALFMPPPTIYYGWRDYSRRSSFGNVREWLHTSWIYDSNFERYQEGLKRFNEFGLDITQYFGAKPPIAALSGMTQAVRERYYSASDEWRQGLARRYGIDYFVFLRKDIVQPSQLPVVYENDHFVIRAATE